MLRFNEYKPYYGLLSEAEELSYDNLVSIANGLGYENIKKLSGNRFAVLVDGNRMEVMKKLEAAIQMKYPEAKHDIDLGSSSIGAIKVGKFSIGVAPASKQGKASAGLGNEHTLFNMLGEMTKDGPVNIEFRAGKKVIRINKVTGYMDAGRDTAGRKKADVVLHTEDKNIPISIKKDKAEMWESADSFWGATAKTWVDKLEKEGKIKVIPHPRNPGVSKIVPEVAIKANAKWKKAVVFGSDILRNGFVIEKTFTGEYKYDTDKSCYVINATKLITKLSDLKGDYEIYFLIRNDSSRKGSKIRPGLRTLAVKSTRINKNVLKVS